MWKTKYKRGDEQDKETGAFNFSNTVDSRNKPLLASQNVTTSTLYRHGYFPKEITRYLAMRLREAKIPCEIGFEKDLAASNSEMSEQLKQTFRDSQPFYFLAFPFEARANAEKALANTSYPLPADAASVQVAEKIKNQQARMQSIKDFRKTMTLLFAALVFLGGLAGLYIIAMLIFEQ